MGNSGDWHAGRLPGGPWCLQQANAASGWSSPRKPPWSLSELVSSYMVMSPKSVSAPSPLSWTPSFYQLPAGCLHLGYFTSCLNLNASLSHTAKSAPAFQVSPPTSCPNQKPASTSDHSSWFAQNFPWFCNDSPMSWEMPLSQAGDSGVLESAEILPSLWHLVQSVTESCQLLLPLGSPCSPHFSFLHSHNLRSGPGCFHVSSGRSQ